MLIQFLNDAAVLFEGAGEFDRAASLYIRNKQWEKVAAILPGIHSNKIHLQYAKVSPVTIIISSIGKVTTSKI
jgi:WD repeat-containing protein 19